MRGETAFQVEGVVIEALPNGTWRVELPNGHNVTAFATGEAKRRSSGLAPGDRVSLQMSPYDLSEGRIIVGTKHN